MVAVSQLMSDTHFSPATHTSSTGVSAPQQQHHLSSQAPSQSQQMSAVLSAAHMMNVSGPSPTSYQPPQASMAQAQLSMPSIGLMSMSQHSHSQMPSQMQGLMANIMSPDMSAPMQQLSLNGQDFSASYASSGVGVPPNLTFDLNAINPGDFDMHMPGGERINMFDVAKE